MGSLLDIALRCERSERSERSELSTESAGRCLLNLLTSLNSHTHEAKTPFRRWRITRADGRVFEVDTWPPATLGEIQAGNPGSAVEAVPDPTAGTLGPADESLIRAVLNAWEATPDEIRDAIAEAASNPRLMDGWRREAEGLGLLEDFLRVLPGRLWYGVPRAPFPSSRSNT